jgi:hypothetical protein
MREGGRRPGRYAPGGPPWRTTCHAHDIPAPLGSIPMLILRKERDIDLWGIVCWMFLGAFIATPFAMHWQQQVEWKKTDEAVTQASREYRAGGPDYCPRCGRPIGTLV